MNLRLRAAFAASTVVAVLGYALLRVLAALNEPSPGSVIAATHTAFYWRVGTACWWGVLAGLGASRFPKLAGAAEASIVPSIVVAVVLALYLA